MEKRESLCHLQTTTVNSATTVFPAMLPESPRPGSIIVPPMVGLMGVTH